MERIKRHKQDNFTVIDNRIFREKKISHKAKGLYATIMSLPNNWDFSISGMVAISKEGKDSIYASIKELISFGYCNKIQDREDGKFQGVDYHFYEFPTDNPSFMDKPNTEKPFTDYPFTENPPQLNTNSIKYLDDKESNKEHHVDLDFSEKKPKDKQPKSELELKRDEVVEEAIDLLRNLLQVKGGNRPKAKEVQARFNELVTGKNKLTSKNAREIILANIAVKTIEWYGKIFKDGTDGTTYLRFKTLFGTGNFSEAYYNTAVLALKRQSLEQLIQEAYQHVGLSQNGNSEDVNEISLSDLSKELTSTNYKKRLEVAELARKNAISTEDFIEAENIDFILAEIRTTSTKKGWNF